MSSQFSAVPLGYEATNADEAEPTGRTKVVLVDDDANVRETLGMVLADEYDVCVCATAEEGVSKVDNDTSTVILDIKMKGHDGFWACRLIRERLPFVPVVFYSAYQGVKNVYEVINEFQPYAYIMKGNDVDELLEAVRRAVKLYQQVHHTDALVSRLRAVETRVKELEAQISGVQQQSDASGQAGAASQTSACNSSMPEK